MPNIKCGVCSKFMSPTDGAKCKKCEVLYHHQCVSLPQSKPVDCTWHCHECKKNVARGKTSDEPAAMNSPQIATVTDIGMELRRIRDELRTVRNEFQAFREEVAELRVFSVRVDDLERRVNDLENANKNQAATYSLNVDNVVAQLKRDLNDRDQEILANDIEIANLPECSGENLNHTVGLIGTKLGVIIEARDIVSAHRAGGRHIDATSSFGPTETRPRPIVVRMARRELRDAILRAARVRRNADTSDLNLPGQPRRFFVNERLTKHNRMLFRQARDAGQQAGWKFVWTSRGHILARYKPGDDACSIRCEADVSRIFGAGVGAGAGAEVQSN